METNTNLKIDKNILDLFWRLCNKNTSTRLQACTDILRSVWKKQQEVQNDNELSKDLQYCIERLVKGLASPRDAARLGYTLLLTEILKKITTVQIEEVLELMKKHLTITGKQDKRDIVFGQLFAYTAIIRSGRLSDHLYLSHVVLSLYDLYHGKNYILNASYEVMLDIFSRLSGEKFKESVWPHLKKKLPADWESCSAESLWILLLSIRLFPNAVSAKYLRNHWKSEDMFESDNFVHFKRIIKQTSASLPMLHPLCSEFLLIIKQRKDFNEIWTAVVEDNLFNPDQKEKAFIGFEMIKLALQNAPTKKVVKTVLSPKFQAVFSKSFMNAKHPMNPAATQLAEFLCTFVKDNTVPDIQIIVLKSFLQPPGTVKLDQIMKKKEVSLITQNLLPDAVKAFYDMLKAILLKKKSSSTDEKEVNNMKRFQAVQQIGILVAHPVILTDMEWRMDVIRFLFLHSFFIVTESTSEISHCDKLHDPLPDALREACMNAFFKTVQSLHMRTENQQSPLNNFLQQLILLTEYAEQLISATDNVDAKFCVEKIQASWSHLKTIVHKLSKQSKKDGQVNESNAFQALFLQLGFLLFQDPEYISEVLEELYICCKKALKARKQEASSEDGENEPPWIGVVVDILLSLLSKSSKHLRNLVTYVFPLFCSFIDQNALQQILDVINPKKGDEDMLVDESGDEEQDVDFASGSSSDESEDEASTQPVDDGFKKKIQEALGPAADASDAESVVLSDSEMFKLDDALSAAFKSQKKGGHTQMGSEDKTMLHFRNRCLDLLICYLKSEPPMHLVLMCVEPILAAFEFGHQSKHQDPLLNKAVSVVQFITRIRKFQNHANVDKSELKRLLEMLIPKCHKEINMSIAQKLYSLCIFIVLCFKKLEHDSPSKKKSSKTPFYIKTYLSTINLFVSSGSSHMLPQFFTNFMEACPDLAWSFIESFKSVAFSTTTRLFKRTQCLGLLSEALKYSKNQKDVKNEQWIEFGSDVIPLAIESLKSALDASDIKQVYVAELLNIIFTSHSIIEDKTGQSLLKKHAELLPLLTDDSGKIKKLNKKGRSWKNKLIICLGGNVNRGKKSKDVKQNESNPEKSKSEEVEQNELSPRKRKSEKSDCREDIINGDVSSKKKKLKHKKIMPVEKIDAIDISNSSDESN